MAAAERERIVVPRCAVERLMRQLGLRGAVRGQAFKTTTVSDELLRRPADLVNRNFIVQRPNALSPGPPIVQACAPMMRLPPPQAVLEKFDA